MNSPKPIYDPWDEAGDRAFLAALERPRPKPKPLTGVISAVAGAIGAHERDHNIRPVELRMSIETARQLAAEAGFQATDDELSAGARVMDTLIAIDATQPFGTVTAWPTPDELMMTRAVAARA